VSISIYIAYLLRDKEVKGFVSGKAFSRLRGIEIQSAMMKWGRLGPHQIVK
jgi:hypothetical protein